MNTQKLTKKSIEVIQKAQDISIENQNQQIEQVHLLYALLTVDESLIKQIFKRMNVSENFEDAVLEEISKLPKFIGARKMDSLYVSLDVDDIFVSAEKTAERMKDQYVSIEHLMIGLFDKANQVVKELFKVFNISKSEFVKILSDVRGNISITNDTPEETYEALKKYGTE